MWSLGLFGCAATAGFPRTHPALRGAALGGATLLAGLALLGQSRGWVFALLLALLVLLVISPTGCGSRSGRSSSPPLLPIRQTLLNVHDEYSACPSTACCPTPPRP